MSHIFFKIKWNQSKKLLFKAKSTDTRKIYQQCKYTSKYLLLSSPLSFHHSPNAFSPYCHPVFFIHKHRSMWSIFTWEAASGYFAVLSFSFIIWRFVSSDLAEASQAYFCFWVLAAFSHLCPVMQQQTSVLTVALFKSQVSGWLQFHGNHSKPS